MSFAEIAEFHQKQIDRQRKVTQFKATVGLACTVWGQLEELARITQQAISLFPEGSRERKDTTELHEFYRAAAKRMDGVQAPGQLNLFGAQSELPSKVR
jgi:hypothetical protein